MSTYKWLVIGINCRTGIRGLIAASAMRETALCHKIDLAAERPIRFAGVTVEYGNESEWERAATPRHESESLSPATRAALAAGGEVSWLLESPCAGCGRAPQTCQCGQAVTRHDDESLTEWVLGWLEYQEKQEPESEMERRTR